MNYLARAGKVFGPFNDIDFAAMKTRGELERFTWLWNAERYTWEPLDLPPPPLVLETLHTSPPPVHRPNKRIEAICHDFHQVVSGVLEAASESGCSIVSKESGAGPAFGLNSQLLLSLLDPSTGNSMNVRAKLESTSRKAGQWHYRLHWESCPEILAA